ncbi:hypothetical protein CASFOL_007153 [Castilleja foliolosa]|uniref:DUF4408 domain-containing protein n=1 Tax=Castilleja foliolosa TaxID=1961234 RepID=A0ABD3E8G0_9LAMI
MLDESASAISSSIWTSLNSWFTPTVLFLLLNLVIATIAFTSSLPNHPQIHKNSQNDPHKPNIAKSPSVLQRLKSINFHTHFRSQEPLNPSIHHKPNPDSETLFNLETTQLQYFFQENLETHFDFDEKELKSDDSQQAREEKAEQSTDGVYGHLTDSHVSRTKSDTVPASGEIPAKLPSRLRKSASLKSPFAHFEEEEIVEARRPETARISGSAKATDGDEEVDAKADDFINRFKQQLKLQRLDSIVRYKDMIGRGK